ncbi:MAG: Trm112 family protein [Gammaproteobacteria bacterium]|nr:Trm112 family protein [Gammaproteobacteria bacterium]
MDPKLLELLRCPQSGAPLVYWSESALLVCALSKRAYPVIDGIPVLLIAESRMLSSEELQRLVVPSA